MRRSGVRSSSSPPPVQTPMHSVGVFVSGLARTRGEWCGRQWIAGSALRGVVVRHTSAFGPESPVIGACRAWRTSGPPKTETLHIKDIALVRDDELCSVNAWQKHDNR